MNVKAQKAFPDMVPMRTGMTKIAGNRVQQSLNVQTPRQSAQLPVVPKQDLHPGAMMNLPIEQITPFEGNPRTVHDPEYYESIKASIRAKGVELLCYLPMIVFLFWELCLYNLGFKYEVQDKDARITELESDTQAVF